ncbi:MAG: LLM class F420-dependent oxidoreductase [Acidimicrobiales bacterium]|nr:LLM class F420-dependent oxidoreductase [Acidimicrobiales bacterium]
MRLCTNIDYAGDLRAAAERAAGLESAGVELVWVAEAYGADAVSLMGFLAARTESVLIGSGILPVYTRTPSLIAQTAVGVDALSGGRCILGLGASGPQVIEGWHGLRYDSPLGRTRDVIEICRKVWRRERVEYEGRTWRVPLAPDEGTGLGKPLKMITHPVRDRIPIFVASLGEKNVAMTAELAEGWLPFMFVPDRANAVWGDALAAGMAKRDPELGPLETVAGGLVAIGPEAEVAAVRDLARPMTALYVGGMGARGKNFYNELFARYGWEADAARIQDLYLDGHKEDAAAAVPAEFLRQSTLVGDDGFVRERLAAYAEAGVTWLSVTPVGPDPVRTLARLRELMP